jgi:hypothetical protein
MLFKLDVTNNQGDTLTLTFDDADAGFELREIDGLDPVKATLVSTSFAQLDGQQYHSSKREMRNILIRIGLEPDFVIASVKNLRDQLYSYFMPKSPITMTFYDDDEAEPTVYILGRVESFEAPLFVSEPEANISILCFDPDFQELTPVDITGNSVSDTTETLLTYDGTVDTGITFIFSPDRDVSEFTFYHRTPDGVLKQSDFSITLHADDVVTMITVPGQKVLTLLRSTTTSSILYAMSPTANWVELAPGDNYIRVFAEGAAIPFEISYTNRYGGL